LELDLEKELEIRLYNLIRIAQKASFIYDLIVKIILIFDEEKGEVVCLYEIDGERRELEGSDERKPAMPVLIQRKEDERIH
jgi:hypothetical protein